MRPIFASTDGRIFFTDPKFAPDLAAVKTWFPEYPVNEDASLYRVSPVFGSVSVAVGWLRELVASIPNRPKLPAALAVGEGSESKLQPAGLGPKHQYEGYVEVNGEPVAGMLFRGCQDASKPSIPTLARPLWLALSKKISKAEAFRVVEEESALTGAFTERFFEDAALHAKMPWIGKMSWPQRGAIARHYGFYSWIHDFTVDPSIAAFFATGGGGTRRPEPQSLGFIQVVDEEYFGRAIGEPPFITEHPGYQSRSWMGVDFETIHHQMEVELDAQRANVLGPPSYAASVTRNRWLANGFSLIHSYVPETAVSRMYRQKWCAVEPFPPLTPIDDMDRLFGPLSTQSKYVVAEWLRQRGMGQPRLEMIWESIRLFTRLASRLLFYQTGETYEVAEEQITTAHLLGQDDEFSQAVQLYLQNQTTKPGDATAAFFQQFS